MKANNKIGGEFEIDPKALTGFSDYCKHNSQSYLYSSGRCALMTILNHLSVSNKKIIHLPYYICESVVQACVNSKYKIEFYEIDSNFLFPLEYLNQVEHGDILLTVNYFGFVDDNPIIKKVKNIRPDIVTVSDCVQSFWTYRNSMADYSFTSLRKHFPTTEGALIHSKDNSISFDNQLSVSMFSYDKLLGSILKHLELPDNDYLFVLKEGEEKLDKDKLPRKANLLSHFFYEKLDLDFIKERRKENYKIVYEIGSNIGLDFMFPYDESVLPLNVPILFKSRDNVRIDLMRKNVFLPVHWPIQYYYNNNSLAVRLSKTELSIVVDQRYKEEDIIYQMEQIKYLLK